MEHLLCVFTTFCAMNAGGGACETYAPLEVNLRYQPGREIAEYWHSPQGAQAPFPALMTEPNTMGFDPFVHFYTSGQLHGTFLISVHPETLAATLTTHISRTAQGPHASAQSSQTLCTRQDGSL